MIHKIFSLINIGEDLIVYVLFLMLFFVVIISIFKTYRLFFNIGKLETAILKVSKNKEVNLKENTLFAKIINFLFDNENASPEALQEIYEAKMIQINKKLSMGNNFLATVGSNAPFIGLFGTVLGVITAFNGLSKGNTGNDIIMIGISTSLIATALGLIVSLPAVFSFNIFKGRQNSINDDTNVIFKIFIANRIEKEIDNISENKIHKKEKINYINLVKNNKKSIEGK